MSKLICHFSSVHHRYDTRVFSKECKALAKDNKVLLIVSDGKGDEIIDNVKIIDVGVQTGRFKRFLFTTYAVYKEAKKNNADIYHFHDPELLPYAYFLSFKTKSIVYDSHEDFPKQLLSKKYIPKIFRGLISKIAEMLESIVSKRIRGVIVSIPPLLKRFKSYNTNTVNINNFPFLDELKQPERKSFKDRENAVAFVGTVTDIRGVDYIIDAIEDTDIKFYLAGPITTKGLQAELQEKDGWKNVEYFPFLDRKEMSELFNKVKVGIVTFLDRPNHVDAQPNKLFEYMSAGLPILSSNFPLWQNIVAGNNCGKCVNPTNISEIKNTLNNMLNDNNNLEEMSLNGIEAVNNKYNWETEEEKLIQFYKTFN